MDTLQFNRFLFWWAAAIASVLIWLQVQWESWPAEIMAKEIVIVKGTVQPKMKILSTFTNLFHLHPRVIPDTFIQLNTLELFGEYNESEWGLQLSTSQKHH